MTYISEPDEGAQNPRKPSWDADDVAVGELPCDGCGADNPVWFTASWLWNLVMGKDRQAILCPGCFILQAEAIGVLPSAWELVPEKDARHG